MIIANTVAEVRAEVNKWKAEGLTVGLVPTMGALHDGHISLVKLAKEQCDMAVASIFVNPTQFSAGEDLDKYPRTFERDCQLLIENGCDMVFAPSVSEMYPDGFNTYMEVTSEMTTQLCSKNRPGHFRGVCTVVGKLFNIATPDKAFFGEKDAQQLAVIRKMVKDMNFPLEIVGGTTIREEDGLAMSSRNVYLSPEERRAAGILYKSIEAAKAHIDEALAGAETVDASAVTSLMREIITTEPIADIEYVDAVDGETLMPKEELTRGDLVALAVHFGKTRLIDNFTV